ncbi:MAG: hypothetical protein NT074_05405 [Methanomicrobiales archaeon]|nr:hypothetical protein [Methanomicrobiales archaeon]
MEKHFEGDDSAPEPRPAGSAGEEVILALTGKFPVVRKLYGVLRIGIAGPLARGEEVRNGPAIELVVTFCEREATFENYHGLIMYLQELLNQPVRLIPEGSSEIADDEWDVRVLAVLTEEAKFLETLITGVPTGGIARDRMRQHAVMGAVRRIAQAAAQMRPVARARHPAVPWEVVCEMEEALFLAPYPPAWGVMEDLVRSWIPREITARIAAPSVRPHKK